MLPAQPISEEQMQRIRAAVAANRTLEAIKLYHDAAGCTLAQATKAIEQMQTDAGSPPTSRTQYILMGLFSLLCGGGLMFVAIAMPTKKNPTFPGVVLGGMFAVCGIWMLISGLSKSDQRSQGAPAWVGAIVMAAFSTVAFWVAIFDSKSIRGGIPFLPDKWNESLGQVAFFAGGVLSLGLTLLILRSALRRK
jgi:hypothetical protein